MEETDQQIAIPVTLFEKWNRALLWLLALEMGYLALVLSIGIVYWLILVAGGRPISGSEWESILSFTLLALPFAFLLNFIGAFGTVVLALRGKHQNCTLSDWVGHILNWTYVAATGWMYIAFILYGLPGLPVLD